MVVGTAIASAIGVRCDAAGQGGRADGPKASRTRLAPHTIEDFPRFDGFLASFGSSLHSHSSTNCTVFISLAFRLLFAITLAHVW